MKFHRCGGAAVMNLVIGLAFFAAGALLLTFSPRRSLTCEHPLRSAASTCVAVESRLGVTSQPNESSDVSGGQTQCPLVPDIQCRIEARILGLVSSYDRSLAGIRDFDLLEDEVERRSTSKARSHRAAVDRTLLFVTAEAPIEMGWHAKVFANLKYHEELMAFARNPLAARIEFVDSRKLPLVVGFVMMALGLMATLSAFSVRQP